MSVLGFAVQLALFVVSWPFDRHRRVAGHWFRLCARSVVKASWLWRFGVLGSNAKPFQGGAVVVSNHESHCDAFLISHLGWEMKWLAKRSLFRIPFIGWMMALAGDVSVSRGQRASADEAMGEMKRYLSGGMPVFLFPEGTRAVTPELLPFKAGAFRLALEANVPIVPLAVTGTRTALMKHSWKFNTSRALVMVGTPIHPHRVREELGIDAEGPARIVIDALIKRTRTQVLQMRGQLEASLAPHSP